MPLKKRRGVWVLGGIILAAIITVLVNLPPLTACDPAIPAADKQRWFQATRTVVQPWRGPHHVYGVFSVPAQYRRNRLYTARLVIQGFAEDLPETSPESGPIGDNRGEVGHYLMRVNLPTRVALWFLITGRFGDLKAPCHWWLVVADRI